MLHRADQLAQRADQLAQPLADRRGRSHAPPGDRGHLPARLQLQEEHRDPQPAVQHPGRRELAPRAEGQARQARQAAQRPQQPDQRAGAQGRHPRRPADDPLRLDHRPPEADQRRPGRVLALRQSRAAARGRAHRPPPSGDGPVDAQQEPERHRHQRHGLHQGDHRRQVARSSRAPRRAAPLHIVEGRSPPPVLGLFLLSCLISPKKIHTTL